MERKLYEFGIVNGKKKTAWFKPIIANEEEMQIISRKFDYKTNHKKNTYYKVLDTLTADQVVNFIDMDKF